MKEEFKIKSMMTTIAVSDPVCIVTARRVTVRPERARQRDTYIVRCHLLAHLT